MKITLAEFVRTMQLPIVKETVNVMLTQWAWDDRFAYYIGSEQKGRCKVSKARMCMECWNKHGQHRDYLITWFLGDCSCDCHEGPWYESKWEMTKDITQLVWFVGWVWIGYYVLIVMQT